MKIRDLITEYTFAKTDDKKAIYLAELKKISWMF